MTQPRYSGPALANGAAPPAIGPSALRSSALARLAFVAGPIVALWLVVALALDLLP